ncbi:protein FAM200B-like [Palaemon carinicauda]|uniref:protein FAM200B-like n=1 Tax=Palaemon carinicauda TaxID=392227 RepID=UPI0035B58C7C
MGRWKTSYEEGRKYNKEWEKEFKWVTARGNACHCKVCNITIASMKKSVLVLHEKGAKHIKNCESVGKHEKTIHSYFGTSAEKTLLREFEIKYSVAVECHSSVRSVDHFTDIIKEYSKKSTLENTKLLRTKCAKIISNVVAKACCEELIEELKNLKFSLLIDESTDVSVSKLLCLCVKFFSTKENILKTEFLALLQITSATGESIFKAIEDFFSNIKVDLANCMGFASDGASNVCGAHNSVLSRLKNISPGIAFIALC